MGYSFYIKSKLRSPIYNNKKSLSAKMFFCVTTKNLNWDIFAKNLVTFKRWDEIIRMKNFNIMGVHLVLKRGSQKTNI